MKQFYADIRHDLDMVLDHEYSRAVCIDKLAFVLYRLADRMERLETDLEAADATASHAANDAACLANGIIPD